MNPFHLYSPLDFFRGIVTPLESKSGFVTPDPPERARAICEQITPADMTGMGGPPPFLTATKLGPMRWRLSGPISPLIGAYFEMQLVVEPEGRGSRVYEHNFARGLLPGSAMFLDFGHRLLTHLAHAYARVSERQG